jgi:hypothetical protein
VLTMSLTILHLTGQFNTKLVLQANLEVESIPLKVKLVNLTKSKSKLTDF